MSKNSDFKNIFESYMGEILLKEADAATSPAEKDPKFQQAKSAWEQMTGKSFDQMPSDQKISISRNVLRPAAQKGYLENPRTKERTPISGTATPSQPAPAQPTAPAAQPAPAPAAQPSPSPSPAPAATQSAPAPVAQAPKPSAVAVPPPADQDELPSNEQDPQGIAQWVGDVPTDSPSQQAAAAPKTQQQQSAGSGASIVDYLEGKGQASDFASRSQLASQYGVQNYRGTAQQNTELLGKLKSGQAPQQKSTGISGAVGSVGNVAKKALIGSEKPLGGVAGAVSKGIGSLGNIAKGTAGAASKVAGGAGNIAKQALTGQKEPMGGLIGGISKGIGSIGNVAKKIVGAKPEAAEEEANEENCEECGKNCKECEKMKRSALNKITVQEKINISKFLKHLSEKNYSSAHKYLRAIVDEKVKTKIAQRIAKN